MNIDSYERWLRPYMLAGKPQTFVIEKVLEEALILPDMTHKKVPVMYFRNCPHALPIGSRLLRESIRELYGPETTLWVGKRITLFPAKERGKDIIRVARPPKEAPNEPKT